MKKNQKKYEAAYAKYYETCQKIDRKRERANTKALKESRKEVTLASDTLKRDLKAIGRWLSG